MLLLVGPTGKMQKGGSLKIVEVWQHVTAEMWSESRSLD